MPAERPFLPELADDVRPTKEPPPLADERGRPGAAPAPLVQRTHELADREVADPAAVLDPLVDGVAEVEADEDA
jgi:hypothetical protein